MEKTDKPPLWVFLAFSSINTRKAALILIWSCVLFTLYCIPWVQFFPDEKWVATLFLIDDISWVIMMIPMVIWYLFSLRWMDKNQAWENN